MSGVEISGGETMAFGRDAPARRWSRYLLGALVVLLAAAGLADRAVREREVEALIADVEDVSAAVALADQRVTAMQLYLRPVAASGATTERLAADLDRLVVEAGARGAQEVLARQQDVADDPVLPWHRDVRLAREALGRYVVDQSVRLGAAGDRDRTPDRGEGGSEVAAALREAVGPSGRLEAALAGLPGAR